MPMFLIVIIAWIVISALLKESYQEGRADERDDNESF